MDSKTIIISFCITLGILIISKISKRNKSKSASSNEPRCYHCETVGKIKYNHNMFYCDFCDRVIDREYMLDLYNEHFYQLQKEKKEN